MATPILRYCYDPFTIDGQANQGNPAKGPYKLDLSFVDPKLLAEYQWIHIVTDSGNMPHIIIPFWDGGTQYDNTCAYNFVHITKSTAGGQWRLEVIQSGLLNADYAIQVVILPNNEISILALALQEFPHKLYQIHGTWGAWTKTLAGTSPYVSDGGYAIDMGLFACVYQGGIYVAANIDTEENTYLGRNGLWWGTCIGGVWNMRDGPKMYSSGRFTAISVDAGTIVVQCWSNHRTGGFYYEIVEYWKKHPNFDMWVTYPLPQFTGNGTDHTYFPANGMTNQATRPFLVSTRNGAYVSCMFDKLYNSAVWNLLVYNKEGQWTSNPTTRIYGSSSSWLFERTGNAGPGYDIVAMQYTAESQGLENWQYHDRQLYAEWLAWNETPNLNPCQRRDTVFIERRGVANASAYMDNANKLHVAYWWYPDAPPDNVPQETCEVVVGDTVSIPTNTGPDKWLALKSKPVEVGDDIIVTPTTEGKYIGKRSCPVPAVGDTIAVLYNEADEDYKGFLSLGVGSGTGAHVLQNAIFRGWGGNLNYIVTIWTSETSNAGVFEVRDATTLKILNTIDFDHTKLPGWAKIHWGMFGVPDHWPMFCPDKFGVSDDYFSYFHRGTEYVPNQESRIYNVKISTLGDATPEITSWVCPTVTTGQGEDAQTNIPIITGFAGVNTLNMAWDIGSDPGGSGARYWSAKKYDRFTGAVLGSTYWRISTFGWNQYNFTGSSHWWIGTLDWNYGMLQNSNSWNNNGGGNYGTIGQCAHMQRGELLMSESMTQYWGPFVGYLLLRPVAMGSDICNGYRVKEENYNVNPLSRERPMFELMNGPIVDSYVYIHIKVNASALGSYIVDNGWSWAKIRLHNFREEYFQTCIQTLGPVTTDPSTLIYLSGDILFMFNRVSGAGRWNVAYENLSKIACNGSTLFYGTYVGNGIIYVYNESNGYHNGAPINSGFSYIDSMCVDRSYIYLFSNNRIHKLALGTYTEVGTSDSFAQDVVDICTDGKYVYASCHSEDADDYFVKVDCYTMATVVRHDLPATFNAGNIATDGSYLYIVDYAGNKINRYACETCADADYYAITVPFDECWLNAYPPGFQG